MFKIKCSTIHQYKCSFLQSSNVHRIVTLFLQYIVPMMMAHGWTACTWEITNYGRFHQLIPTRYHKMDMETRKD